MTQFELNHAVAAATGESVDTVSYLGFSVADPEVVEYDPEPCDVEDLIVDWDEVETRRNTPLVPVLV